MNVDPLSVACPYCGATPGYPCRNPHRSATVARPGNPHASRRALAESES